MSRFSRSVMRVITGGAQAFSRYPAAMFFAFLLAFTGSIRVATSSSADLLLNSIQMASVLGAALGMAAVAASTVKQGRTFFVFSQAGTVLMAVVAFLILYLPGGDLSSMAMNRIAAATGIALVLFLLLLSRRQTNLSFGGICFVTLRSAAIAALYTLVLIGGLEFLVFSIEFLIAENLNEDLYAHVAIWSALIGYALFLGRLPDTEKWPLTESDAAETQQQPAFFEVLFSYVIIPIIGAVSLVLLIWAVQMPLTGDWPEFEQLSAIFSAYVLVGLAVIVLSARSDRAPAGWFRRLFPLPALVFLVFEGIAIGRRIGTEGLDTASYVVSLITLAGAVAVVLLLIRRGREIRWVGWIAIAAIAVSVLPIAGYADLPALAQGARAERILDRYGMLDGDSVIPSTSVTAEDERTLSDAIMELSDSDSPLRPDWFDENMSYPETFLSAFGFNPVFYADVDQPFREQHMNLMTTDSAIDLEGYSKAFVFSVRKDTQTLDVTLGERAFTVTLDGIMESSEPGFEVMEGRTTIIEKDLLSSWLEDAVAPYWLDETNSTYEEKELQPEDLTMRISMKGVNIMLVFRQVSFSYDPVTGPISYYLEPAALYMGLKES